jgi:hypothetical protein
VTFRRDWPTKGGREFARIYLILLPQDVRSLQFFLCPNPTSVCSLECTKENVRVEWFEIQLISGFIYEILFFISKTSIYNKNYVCNVCLYTNEDEFYKVWPRKSGQILGRYLQDKIILQKHKNQENFLKFSYVTERSAVDGQSLSVSIK